MTTNVTAKQGIYDDFLAGWTDPTVIILEGEDKKPPTDAPYVKLFVRHFVRAQETLGGIGARKFQSDGLIVAQIFTPLDKGSTPADNLALLVQGVLEGKTLTNTVHTNEATINEIGDTDDGYQINVSTEFYYHETK